jgi:signal transduction histidine kinase
MYAYLTTPDGHLIAHTSAGLVRQNLDFSHLPQVAAIESPSGPIDTGKNIDGEAVLTATAPLPRMNWSLFVEQPLSQAFEPIYDLLLRLLWLFAFCVVLSVAVSMLFARRMVVPIKAVQAGAAQIAAGGFTHTIEVHTGDEVEALADEFNRMARQLQESYARLEQKVEDRTEDLGRSVRELQALEEIGRAVAASLDLDSVLATIVTRAAELANADGGAIYSFDRDGRSFHLAKVHGLDQDFVNAMSRVRMNRLDGLMGAVAVHGRPIQVPQISEAPDFPLRAATLAAGFKSALIVPLLSAGGVRGTLIVERRRSGHFPARIVELMQTFAHQCVLAMHNASLFRQVEENSRQLAIASEHKTQFFANMSHELRTPLNAVLGYAELLQDGLYGELPDRAKQVLERIQSNGTHLLGLINDVLDLSKIEAGELSLSLETYSMRNVVENVVGATGSLAQAKALRVSAEIEDALPLGRGDERRLTQVLLNMVSNAIKFTDQGGITIRARKSGENFDVSVEDTGPGIAPEDQARIFEAFQQVDNTSTRQKGGTGLGLSISKRFVEMHGGRIEVSSTLGIGSTFRFILPIHVDQQRQAA